jgi:vacuolar-type H+-ATPase subunit I/STV1
MFDHPFLFTLAISVLLSFLRVIFVKRSFLAFVSQFISFPYWAVILIFVFFHVIRSVRSSRAYRLLHTIYHESSAGPARSYLNFTPQPDEFGLDQI